MNIDQAEGKLAEIKRSTGTKHVKTLISELCNIVGFLLNEIKNPPMVSLSRSDDSSQPPSTRPPHIDPLVPCQPPRGPDKPEDVPIRKLPPVTIVKSRPINPPHPHRKGDIEDIADRDSK